MGAGARASASGSIRIAIVSAAAVAIDRQSPGLLVSARLPISFPSAPRMAIVTSNPAAFWVTIASMNCVGARAKGLLPRRSDTSASIAAASGQAPAPSPRTQER